MKHISFPLDLAALPLPADTQAASPDAKRAQGTIQILTEGTASIDDLEQRN